MVGQFAEPTLIDWSFVTDIPSRNCTKHQVQCDYMESLSVETESPSSPPQPSVMLDPGMEAQVEQWEQTAVFPFPALSVFPPLSIQGYSRTELRLVHHIASVSNDLMHKGSNNLTIWTDKVPNLLSLASSHPFVMHALMSFSAGHLAFTQSGSGELRNLQTHHGAIALRGTHDAITNFSHENADALLAASQLLAWQCTDW